MHKVSNIMRFRLAPLTLLFTVFLSATLLLSGYVAASVGAGRAIPFILTYISPEILELFTQHDVPESAEPVVSEPPVVAEHTAPVSAVKPTAHPVAPNTGEFFVNEYESATAEDAETAVAEAFVESEIEVEEIPEYRFVSADGSPVYDYTYGNPVPETTAVDDEFFSNAVFLGDSRTEGLKLYSGLKTAEILAARSISTVNIHGERVIPDENGGYKTILEALAEKSYAKVYIMLGINEIGLSPEDYYSKYEVLINDVIEMQPDADIFIQALIPVSREKDEDESGFTNAKIELFNAKASQLASEYELFYVDTYTPMLDDTGFLPSDASFDGIHLYPDYCVKWLEYLKTHTLLSYRNTSPEA